MAENSMVTNESIIKSVFPFANRHIGPDSSEQGYMLKTLGMDSLEQLIKATIPESIRAKQPLAIGPGLSEPQALAKMKRLAQKNLVFKTYIGTGYYNCHVPPVIQRNILENPGWYTQYTPYQAEISQGRLEALFNFQTLVSDLTGLPIANASLLDEPTAAAEAMTLCFANQTVGSNGNATPLFWVSHNCHPQTLAVIKTRAEPLGIEVMSVDFTLPLPVSHNSPFGVLLQYPGSDGLVLDTTPLIAELKAKGIMIAMATDLLALTLLKSPGEMGADIAIGNSQRLGVPLGFGGPHAAFFATKDDLKRKIPGRLIGLSKDSTNQPALRMSLQTREQHIRREKATSNICTSQVLLAVMNSMYAVYHGPEGLKNIAKRVHSLTTILAKALESNGLKLVHKTWFDTLSVDLSSHSQSLADLKKRAESFGLNLRFPAAQNTDKIVGISLDETTTAEDLCDLLTVFAGASKSQAQAQINSSLCQPFQYQFSPNLTRTSPYLTHPVFHLHRSETQMLRYIRLLESRDLSLTRSMIPLGSCTMKLNATAELFPITWPEWNGIHPHAPQNQWEGYAELFRELESSLAACTGFDAVSLQPNSGAQGEYAGLLAIRKYHQCRGDHKRTVCLIPKSAHGTNPASAVMAGMQVIIVECDKSGNIDLEDLKAKASEHRQKLAALMITYPSTHGVFEDHVRLICDTIHECGGMVYMDGANLNAQVGLCRPGEFGPDVCHLNLHKTFCIPHGGGGPGMGPIAVKKHLAPYLPNHPLNSPESGWGHQSLGTISGAPWGSASILPISMMYIWMMGGEGLTQATQVAILNANYMAHRLQPHYPVLYRGASGQVAHECIIDLRPLKSKTGIEVEDVAKRLMDYGFHAPTVSFPVAGTLMIEPTESESLVEIDRFCEAMISIRQEITEVENGIFSREHNVLTMAPHTQSQVMEDSWDRPYSREKAAFPLPWVKTNKFWPYVSRIDSAFGDRNLICTCPPMSSYEVVRS